MINNLPIQETFDNISDQAIGIFDSGIGGLTVANAVFRLLPNEQIIYVGDTARIPYGNKSKEEIRKYSFEIIQFLLSKGCKIIVIACNTASAAALNAIRKRWPNISFIGMEPAIKPAAEYTQQKKIAVLATAGTFKSQRYAKLMEDYTQGIKMIQNPCTGLVKLIEKRQADTLETKALLQSILHPMLKEGADTFVLGCTHYPFVQTTIQEIIGPKAKIINPAPAIARHLQYILKRDGLENSSSTPKEHLFYATGDKLSMDWAIQFLFGKEVNFTVKAY